MAPAFAYVSVELRLSCYAVVMPNQNFDATAKYFDRRARKPSSRMRQSQLEDAARYYRVKAEEAGQTTLEPEMRCKTEIVPMRRRRLMELFRAYGRASDAT
jgi:hypothetical protein